MNLLDFLFKTRLSFMDKVLTPHPSFSDYVIHIQKVRNGRHFHKRRKNAKR